MTTKDLVYAGIARFVFGVVSFVFLLVVFNSCSTIDVDASVNNYRCDLTDSSNVYAQIDVSAHTIQEALRISDALRDRLLLAHAIPPCISECELESVEQRERHSRGRNP